MSASWLLMEWSQAQGGLAGPLAARVRRNLDALNGVGAIEVDDDEAASATAAAAEAAATAEAEAEAEAEARAAEDAESKSSSQKSKSKGKSKGKKSKGKVKAAKDKRKTPESAPASSSAVAVKRLGEAGPTSSYLKLVLEQAVARRDPLDATSNFSLAKSLEGEQSAEARVTDSGAADAEKSSGARRNKRKRRDAAPEPTPPTQAQEEAHLATLIKQAQHRADLALQTQHLVQIYRSKLEDDVRKTCRALNVRLKYPDAGDASKKAKGKRRRQKSSNGLPPPPSTLETAVPGDQALYCVCNQPYIGEMIACDDDDCPVEWWHLDCAGYCDLSSAEEWICHICLERRKEQT